jgi:hypothetical protein
MANIPKSHQPHKTHYRHILGKSESTAPSRRETRKTMEVEGSFFEVNLTYQGKSNIVKVSAATTGSELHQTTLNVVFGVTDTSDDVSIEGSTTSEVLKLLFKGKRIIAQPDTFPFKGISTTKKKPLKIMVVATNISAIQELSMKRSDPTIRGFDQEKDALERKRKLAASQKYWGDVMVQDREYKFCRMEACTDHSFGHRANESTPHAFKAMELLEKLATDPGVVAVMKERELVVGTLGEMDPIDDRIMQKQEAKGGCLLGYNTNHGLRIDIKLRTEDLSAFRSYQGLVSTLIHELSHNWVGEHNLLFWLNYAQMRAEYLCTHAKLRKSALIVRGKKTATLAGLNEKALDNVFGVITSELVGEMGQFGLHPNMIAEPVRQRIRELEAEMEHQQGCRLVDTATTMAAGSNNNNNTQGLSTRELALAAAERRAREQKEKEKNNKR